MARNTERRRRVMKEEVLSASFAAYKGSMENQDIEPGDTPRYGAGANIENHPQITDFVPRRYRVIGSVFLLILCVGIVAEVISYFAPSIHLWTEVVSVEEIRSVLANRMVAWASATMLLCVACYMRLIHSLRRHRVDDSRGRYRIWRLASWTAVFLSCNAVVGIHEPIARILGNLSGWNLLSGNVGWWIIPSGLIGLWLMTKIVIDVAECRAAQFSYALSVVFFGLAVPSLVGWTPLALSDFPGLELRTLPLIANLLLLIGTLLNARFVVLDVQGLIEHHSAPQAENHVEQATPELQQSSSVPASEAPQESTATTDKWVDGSEPETLEETSTNRKLSKAERKRLRKLKNQQRAA